MVLRYFLRARLPFTFGACFLLLWNLSDLTKLGIAGITMIIIKVLTVVVILGGEVALRRYLAQEGVKLPPSSVAVWNIFPSRAGSSPRGKN